MITNLGDLHPAWADRFNDRDMDGMLALCEDGSAFAPQPGVVLTEARCGVSAAVPPSGMADADAARAHRGMTGISGC